MGKCQPWWNALLKMNKQQIHPMVQWQKKKKCHRKQMWKTRWKHTLLCCHLSHMHAHTNQNSYNARNSSVCAFCYGDNESTLIRQCFLVDRGGMGSRFVLIILPIQPTTRKIALGWGRNSVYLAISLSTSFTLAATRAHPLSLTTSN